VEHYNENSIKDQNLNSLALRLNARIIWVPRETNTIADKIAKLEHSLLFIKILSSLPLSYAWEIIDKVLTNKYAQISGTLTVRNGDILRSADSMGIFEYSELRGNSGLHFMNARAETRALKRAIEVLFGSVINYFVINQLQDHNRFAS